jgi:hypothetical protein
MPTVYINGVKHTPSSRTMRKMRASGQKFSTEPPTGVKATKAVVRTSSKGVGAKGVSERQVRRAGGNTPAAAAPVPRPRSERPKDERKNTSGSGSFSVAVGARRRTQADAGQMASSGSNSVGSRTGRERFGPPTKPVGTRMGTESPGPFTRPVGPGGTPIKGYGTKGRSIAATGVTVPSPENAMKKKQREARQAIYERANRKRKGN